MTDEEQMARDNYGYGSWDAPFWFIGPEQGQSSSEESDARIKAWHSLGRRELNDSYEFHRRIKKSRWHEENPKLQGTWKKLMLTLLSFKGEPTDEDARLQYQRHAWGRQSAHGETCVIELSGLAASSQATKTQHDSDLDRIYIDNRIETIRNRIADFKPKTVVMYAKAKEEAWLRIAEGAVEITKVESPFAKFWQGARIWKLGPTILTTALHPTAPYPRKPGPSNLDWIELGQILSKVSGDAV